VESFEELGSHLLVVYDGHCVLCNRSVRWLLARDRRDRLRFAPSTSPKVAELLARQGTVVADSASGPASILVIRDLNGPAERLLVRSDAAVALLAELPRPWPTVAVALGLFPRPLRDLGYRLVARWRYRIWGRLENCPIPTAEERSRFL